MSGLRDSNQAKIAAFFRERIGDAPLVVPADGPPTAWLDRFLTFAQPRVTMEPAELEDWLRSATAAPGPVGCQLDSTRSLIVAAVCGETAANWLVISIQNGPVALACRVVSNALESWNLTLQVSANRTALEDSAMQLAQCFEEQDWLRGFARNASSLAYGTSANSMADAILQPLGYLLRAQDIFLMVGPGETERSSLTCAKYGSSKFSIATIRELLEALDIAPTSPPKVQNNVAIATREGLIRSLIVVSVLGSEHALGHLVGINRSTDLHADGLPVYDPEFGSGDVGLLEEAGVLLATQAHNIHLLVQSNQLFLGTLYAMSSAIDARDKYTQGHSERVARLAFDLARIQGLSEEACQEIYLAGILHDVGKIGIPDRVLLKEGPLTADELKIIQQHPEIGHRIVERLGHLQFALPGVLYHHERWDGRGYPHGLSGASIPLMARLMAVADAFDAMTSSRPYRNAMPVEQATHIITMGSGQQWDPQAVECFKLWLQQRVGQPIPLVPHQSIIPHDSPVEHMLQAVMALGH